LSKVIDKIRNHPVKTIVTSLTYLLLPPYKRI
jgi:hypothetical protein